MPISRFTAIERIARGPAGRQLNASAARHDPHAGGEVDGWFDYREDAVAILRTMREPDMVMANAGDPDIWRAMVEAAIEDYTGNTAVADADASPVAQVGDHLLKPPTMGPLTD